MKCRTSELREDTSPIPSPNFNDADDNFQSPQLASNSASSSSKLTVQLADERPIVGFQSADSPAFFGGLSSSDNESAGSPEQTTADTSAPIDTQKLFQNADQAQHRHEQEKAQAAVLKNVKDKAAKAFAIAQTELQLAETKYKEAGETLKAAQEAYDQQAKEEAESLREAQKAKVVTYGNAL